MKKKSGGLQKSEVCNGRSLIVPLTTLILGLEVQYPLTNTQLWQLHFQICR